MITAEVTWGGSRDNPDGKVWLKFIAAFSEVAEVSKCVLLTKRQCYLLAQWNGQPQQIAVAMYNGKVDTPEGEFRVSFISDQESVNQTLLSDLKRSVAGSNSKNQKTFMLKILTVDEVSDIQDDDTPEDGAEQEEYHDEQESATGDATEEITL